ncbi:MAG: nucleotidyltransferase family protein [Elusimicrobia bacterium]|nr:nucleotidyltransferase family protein [Elusimicrobiota bacterium]
MNKNILSRNIILMDCLDVLARACLKKNIDLIVLKGGSLLLSGVFKLGEREMTDEDILLKEEDEASFKEILELNHFAQMPNSSDAYFKMIGKNAPPLIIDIHKKMLHVKDIKEIWQSKIISPLEKNPNLFILNYEDVFLHLIAHNLLHHGSFPDKAKKDLIEFLKWIKANKNSNSFLRIAAEKSRYYKLNSVIYYPLKEIFKSRPDLLDERSLVLFRLKGMEKIKRYFLKTPLSNIRLFWNIFFPFYIARRLFWDIFFRQRNLWKEDMVKIIY